MNPAALASQSNAKAVAGMSGDAGVWLRQYANTNSLAHSIPNLMGAQANLQVGTPGPQHSFHQPSNPATNSSGVSTPEPKPKGRPKGSTKKRREEENNRAASFSHLQGLPHAAMQQMQGPYPNAAPFQTPTQSHPIPMASPAHAVPQNERARSHTQSPTISQNPAAVPQTGLNTTFAGSAPQQVQNAPPGWTPTLSATQQQQLLGQALSFSKVQSSARGQGAQPQQSPAHILMQMGYVYVKADVLPNNGFGAGIPGNSGSAPGAVLSIDEAKSLGIFGSQHQQQPQKIQNSFQQGSTSQTSNPSHMQRMQSQPSGQGNGLGSSAMPFSQLSQMQSIASPHTPQQASNGFQASNVSNMPPTLQQQGPYRASPLGMTESPGPSQLPPESPAIAVIGSPSGHRKGTRTRQPSVVSRPGSSGGRPLDQSMQAPNSQVQRLSMPGQTPDQPGAASSVSRNTPAHVSMGSTDLPPLYGGSMPLKTKQGYDISPEYNTRFTPLPASDVLSADGTHYAIEDEWKPMSGKEETELLDIMRKDSEYTKLMTLHSGRTTSEILRHLQRIQPQGRLHWWERGSDEDQSQLGKDGPFENFKILLPGDKRGQRAAQGVRSAYHLGLTSRQIQMERNDASSLDEDLVPIRLEIDHEGWKLRDTFTWPAPESFKTELIDRFVAVLCDDFGLPIVHFAPAIREAILSQVSDHTAAEALRPIASKKGEAENRGKLSNEDLDWWREWREKVNKEDTVEMQQITERGRRNAESKTIKDESVTEPDMRIQIKLDITVGAMNLVDQFEWDLSDEGTSAETFASVFAADLGLSGEFRTAIAHSIREQVDVHIRSLVLVGYDFEGGEIPDEELRSALLGPVNKIARLEQEVEAFTPKLLQLSEFEILQLEKEREREARRKRRQTRGRRGVNLPDREHLKTARTPAIAEIQQSGQMIDVVNNNGNESSSGRSTFDSSSRAAAGMSTRRAAAMVANASISQAAAAEFGTPTPVPESSGNLSGGRSGDREATKRRRLDSHATHFDYPGGLGKIEDDSDETSDQGPKFSLTQNTTSSGDHRGVELGGLPANLSQSKLQTSGIQMSSPYTPTTWNMSRPEQALNQVANWHDGQWYCSNCGVPGNMDVSRRKGPLGDGTLCGMCGKYFHRHRKARPVQYTRDKQHHLRQLQARGIFVNMEASDNKSVESEVMPASIEGSRSGAANDSDARMEWAEQIPDNTSSNGITSNQEDDVPSEHTEALDTKPALPAVISRPASTEKDTATVIKTESASQVPLTRGNSPELPFEQVGSPDDSDASDNVDQPSPVKSQYGTQAAHERSASPSKASATPQPSAMSPTTVASKHATATTTRVPEWLMLALHGLRSKYPFDRFEIIPRPRPAGAPAPAVPEWRIRCNDCPGKVCTGQIDGDISNLIHSFTRPARRSPFPISRFT